MDRKTVKSNRPSFSRYESGQKKRIGTSWRFPKGHQNKTRLGTKGYPARIDQGYRMPVALRNKDTATGLDIVYVKTIAELKGLDAKTQGIIVASSVGIKKKEAIFEAATKAKITVLNIKDTAAYIKARKDKKAATKAPEKPKPEPKKAESKTDKKSELSEEEQTKEEKKQQEKVLLHKEA